MIYHRDFVLNPKPAPTSKKALHEMYNFFELDDIIANTLKKVVTKISRAQMPLGKMRALTAILKHIVTHEDLLPKKENIKD